MTSPSPSFDTVRKPECHDMTPQFYLRLATLNDAPKLRELIALSVHGLMQQVYTPTQLDTALGTWLGLDTKLIADGTCRYLPSGSTPTFRLSWRTPSARR